MIKIKENLGFLLHCLRGYDRDPICPACGAGAAFQIDRKYVVARLFECVSCRLRFRHPQEDAVRLSNFYQQEYRQDDGITTDLPSEVDWLRLLADGFGEKDVRHYIEAIRCLLPDAVPADIRMIDYGCSWGYQCHQFMAAGYDCHGFELSVPRAHFGRDTLGLPIHTSLSDLPDRNDIFFASHVIEHVPSPRQLLEIAFDLLKPGGYLFIESPNGADDFRMLHPGHFHRLWGRVHPHLLSPAFYLKALNGAPCLLTSVPFTDLPARLAAWDRASQCIERLDGPSLLLIARKS